MKNLNQTEKHLADKLQNVPVPDVDQGWEQMRKLLENEMPEPVAGAWSGNRKWWWMGITAGLIMLATWVTQELNSEAVLADKKNVPAAQVEKGSGVNAGGENGAVKPNASVVKASENNNGSSSANNNSSIDKNIATGNNSSTDNGSSIDNSSIDKNDNAGTAKNDVAKENKPVVKDVLVPPTNNQGGSLPMKDNVSRTNRQTPLITNVTRRNKNVASDDAVAISKPTNNLSTDNSSTSTTQTTDEIESSVVNTSVVTETMLLESPADHFNEIENFQPEQIAVTGKTDKAFARELRRKSMKADNRRLSKSSMRGGNRDNEHEITFAAGLALPQSFAVGSQQASSYNVNAKSSRITDYLPAPFFQYHINDKLFVQTEFHFQSPQYTQRLLLSRDVDSFANRRFESNVHLEKLYYFNIPFNVYYSPVRNFYIGGGLQYSSLLSGVASYENKSVEGQTVLSQNSVTRRFNQDSVAAVFSPSEWRYQFDANYYLNRFTLGLRFNQAMKDFINTSGGTYVPATRDRNRSFQLYLRFNIWEERRKEAN